MERNS